MSKMSLTDENGTYTIEIPEEELTLPDYFERLIIPVLRCAGFSKKAIDAYMDNEPRKCQ